VGTTVHAKEHFINMEGVIPNSKVVILPSAKEGESWRRELFLRPGDWIPWVTVTVVVGTAILAIIVFVLHLNEKVRTPLPWSSLVLSCHEADYHLVFFSRGKTSSKDGELHIISTLTPCDRLSLTYAVTCILRLFNGLCLPGVRGWGSPVLYLR
jgi:hypothetical protein